MYNSGNDILKACDILNKPIWEIVLLDEIENQHTSESDIFNRMEETLRIMENSISYPIDNKVETVV